MHRILGSDHGADMERVRKTEGEADLRYPTLITVVQSESRCVASPAYVTVTR